MQPSAWIQRIIKCLSGITATTTTYSLLVFMCVSCSGVYDSLQPHGLWLARLLCPQGFSRQEYCSGLPCPPPGDLPVPGIEPGSPAQQADSLPSEPPGKPKNTGVSCLSLFQRIFPTQESNWGLRHCRRILTMRSLRAATREKPTCWNKDPA